jgi:hypothetical protein
MSQRSIWVSHVIKLPKKVVKVGVKKEKSIWKSESTEGTYLEPKLTAFAGFLQRVIGCELAAEPRRLGNVWGL